MSSASCDLRWTRGRYVFSLLFKVFPDTDGMVLARALRAWVRHVERDLGLRGRLIPRRTLW